MRLVSVLSLTRKRTNISILEIFLFISICSLLVSCSTRRSCGPSFASTLVAPCHQGWDDTHHHCVLRINTHTEQRTSAIKYGTGKWMNSALTNANKSMYGKQLIIVYIEVKPNASVYIYIFVLCSTIILRLLIGCAPAQHFTFNCMLLPIGSWDNVN